MARSSEMFIETRDQEIEMDSFLHAETSKPEESLDLQNFKLKMSVQGLASWMEHMIEVLRIKGVDENSLCISMAKMRIEDAQSLTR